MRAFHLFAGLIGISMILIAVGLGYFMNRSEEAYSTVITKKIYAYSAVRVSDVIREDAYSSMIEDLRKDFQEFFEVWGIDPPEECWESSEKFEKWFEDVFSKSEKVTDWLAKRMAYYLKGYQGKKLGDYSVRVDVNTEEVKNALKHIVSFKKMGDGTFMLVLDMRDVSEDVYAQLPKIKVCKGYECYDSIVFPRGLWTLHVPLRVFEAYKKARNVWYDVRQELDEYKLMFGFCDEEFGGCGLFRWSGGPKLVFPSEKYVEDRGIKVIPGEESPYFVENFLKGACTGVYLIENENVVSCSDEEEMQGFLYDVIQSKLEREGVDVSLLESSIKTYKTAPIYSQVAINVLEFAYESSIFSLVLSVLGINPGVGKTKVIWPLTGCSFEGYAYCAVPATLSYTVTWEDPDEAYKVLEKPARFKFYQSFDLGISKYYKALEKESEEKRIEEGGYTTREWNGDEAAAKLCAGTYASLLASCSEENETNMCESPEDPFVKAFCEEDASYIINNYSGLLENVEELKGECKNEDAESLFEVFEQQCKSIEDAKNSLGDLSKVFSICEEKEGVFYSYYWQHIGGELKATCASGSVVP